MRKTVRTQIYTYVGIQFIRLGRRLRVSLVPDDEGKQSGVRIEDSIERRRVSRDRGCGRGRVKSRQSHAALLERI